ncbi:MFS-type transporter SLC18B1-like [Glandiceps talaboti]
MDNVSKARKVSVLICICFSQYFLMACYSIIAPFYPVMAIGKGVEPLTVGFVLASFALVSVIVSPPLGTSVSTFGSKFIFCLGCAVAGFTALLFGCLDFINDPLYFTVCSFIIRIIQACGVQAGNTASVVIVYQLFPNNVAFILGVSQIFAGVGLITGPTVGGVLYAVYGFTLPFIVLGGVLLLSVLFAMCLIPKFEGEHLMERGRMCPLLLMVGILLGMLLRTVTAIEITFLDSTMELALLSLDIDSAAIIGMLFLLAGIGYGISAPIWGLVGDKWDIYKELNLLGLGIGAFGYLLIGPSPLLEFDSTIGIMASGLTLMGFGVGAIITIIPDMVNTAIEKGHEDNLALYGMVSGLYYCSYNLGMFIGPIMGSALFQEYGFPWSCSIVAAVVVGSFVLYALYVGFYRCSQLLEATRDLRNTESEFEMSSGSYYEPLDSARPAKQIQGYDDEDDEYDAEKNPFFTSPNNYSAADTRN